MPKRSAWDRKMDVVSENGAERDCAAPIKAKAATICPVIAQRSPSTAGAIIGAVAPSTRIGPETNARFARKTFRASGTTTAWS